MKNNINIGYACITLGINDVKIATCKLRNASEERVKEIITHNLDVLEKVIEYNHEHQIRLFRISSDIIPFASHPNMKVRWREIYQHKLEAIGKKINKYRIRVSMHPGQYTVLNSPNEEVVKRAVAELKYHAEFLDALGMDETSKIILHVGGVYNNKGLAIQRFIENYKCLNDAIKKRLVIENDDKNYHIEDILRISKEIKIPVVFDNLHHEINHIVCKKNIRDYILECRDTWKEEDGKQKIHYSQQNVFKNRGAHSETISVKEFLAFYENLPHNELDIMLEVKDKNLSAVKCILCTQVEYSIYKIEKEWANYKYYVLGKNQNIYLKIRALLKNKDNNIAKEFYGLIEEALDTEEDKANEINAIQHIMGYFSKYASQIEKKKIDAIIVAYKKGDKRLNAVKNQLNKLAVKYDIDYIVNSYYFLDM